MPQMVSLDDRETILMSLTPMEKRVIFLELEKNYDYEDIANTLGIQDDYYSGKITEQDKTLMDEIYTEYTDKKDWNDSYYETLAVICSRQVRELREQGADVSRYFSGRATRSILE